MSDWSDAQIGRMLGRIAALEKRVRELEAQQQPTQAIGKQHNPAYYDVDRNKPMGAFDLSAPPLSPH